MRNSGNLIYDHAQCSLVLRRGFLNLMRYTGICIYYGVFLDCNNNEKQEFETHLQLHVMKTDT